VPDEKIFPSKNKIFSFKISPKLKKGKYTVKLSLLDSGESTVREFQATVN
jgi:hypothetical protein